MTSEAASLFAGELRFGFLGDHRLSYSFLTRHNFDIRIEKRADLIDLIPDPSIDLFTASISFEQNMNDYWGGLTWAFPLNPRVGVGVTTFVSVRDQRVRRRYRQAESQRIQPGPNADLPEDTPVLEIQLPPL